MECKDCFFWVGDVCIDDDIRFSYICRYNPNVDLIDEDIREIDVI